MMRTIAASALALALALGASAAHAQTQTPAQTPYPVLSQVGPYVTGHLGGSFTTDDPYNDFVVGGGLGWRFSPMFRMDATFDYRPDTGPDYVSMSNWTAMVNGYVDFDTLHLGRLVPYVKGGLGFAESSVDNGPTADHFAWDVGGGLSVAVSDRTAVDLDYQYISMGHTPVSYVALHANEVKLGLRIGF